MKEPLVVLFNNPKNVLNKKLPLADPEIMKLDFSAQNFSVLGLLPQNPRPHPIVSGELLERRPLEILLLVGAVDGRPPEDVGGVAEAAGEPAPAAAGGPNEIVGGHCEGHCGGGI